MRREPESGLPRARNNLFTPRYLDSTSGLRIVLGLRLRLRLFVKVMVKCLVSGGSKKCCEVISHP